MFKITLRLLPTEWLAILRSLPLESELRSMINMPTNLVTLAEWRLKAFGPVQQAAWQRRSSQQEYAFTIPLSIALILWHEMQYVEVIPPEQTLLIKLDKALIDKDFNPANRIIHL